MAGPFDPLHQFQVVPVWEIEPVTIAGVTIDLSITNSVLAMLIGVGLVIVFFGLTTARASIIPGRFQVMAESLFGLVDNLAESIIGHEGRAFFPFVFTLFLFILSCNLIGMTTYFTATSQIAVTLTLAVLTIGTVIVVGFAKNGLGFFKLFVPSGVPWWLLPMIVIIEVVSFLMRPITLTLRLFGNMVGGHIVLKVFAQFVVWMVAAGGLALAGAAISLVSVVALTTLEFLVAYLQAFVFAVLACVYLNDVVNLHHH
ncbi:F0F1 ATP synthase subunit A [Asticcacaulis excentricus]|uniref:ATP synthase subunit a n=1 Tax=Asticcacaulis excentricus TaxID=78587 RepID=A0A3G9G6F8_9CAUL|nr:F0F1 ATP synthase subunit A [Asticcacaulis excentricus]BBF79819.1 ATP synthase F0 sector subunit a [Asticcacaulis excentricus]